MAMLKIMSYKKNEDFVIATGQMYSVLDFAEKAFSKLNLSLEKYIQVNKSLLRPNEVDDLLGDASKAKSLLGWTPSVNFDELIDEMLESDLRLIRNSL